MIKIKIFILTLSLFSAALVSLANLSPTAAAEAPAPADPAATDLDVPHLDKVFLITSELREQMVSDLIYIIQPFCDQVDRSRADINPAALESCELKSVVAALDASEKELDLKNGIPFVARLAEGHFSEAAMWRYFIRLRKAQRVVKSIGEYLSQGADGMGVQIKGMTMPMLAGSLDRYSYWTRLLAMKEAQTCDLSKTPGNLRNLCVEFNAQLYTLGQTALAAATKGAPTPSPSVASPSLETDRLKNLELISLSINKKLKALDLDELTALENMQDVSSAGMGVTFFRQLVSRLQVQVADVSPLAQRQIQRTMLVDEIRAGVAAWPRPEHSTKINAKAEALLENEMKNLLSTEKQN